MPEQSRRRLWSRRGAGLTLMFAAVLGAALAVIAFFGVIFGLGGVERSVSDSLASLDEALVVTTEGLDVAALTLGEANTTLASLSDTLGSATRAITDTLPTLDTVADLTGDDLPASIRSTQAALGSARETARVVDRVLGAISSIGLLNSGTYNPEVPLNEAIAGVSVSLDDLPPALTRVEAGLRSASGNLSEVNADLVTVAAGVDDIAAGVRRASASIGEYRRVTGDLRVQIASLREQLPGWFTGLRVGLLLGLLWFAAAQLSMLVQGWGLLVQDRSPRAE